MGSPKRRKHLMSSLGLPGWYCTRRRRRRWSIYSLAHHQDNESFLIGFEHLKTHKSNKAHFTLGVKANVQPKSSIPIGAKVEISPKGFTLGVKAELEKNLFNLPKVTHNAELYGLVLGPRLEKRIPSNLGGQFATLGTNVSAFVNILTSMC
jgi:hypothetical protein